MTLEDIAYERAMLKFMESKFVEHFRLIDKKKEFHRFPSQLKGNRFLTVLEEVHEMNLENVKRQMLTINPPDSVKDWNGLKRLVELVVKRRNLLIDPLWCFEQRSEDPNNPHGFHVHIAFSSAQRKSEIIRRVFTDLEKVFDEPKRQWIDINDNSPNAYDYIKGEKISEKQKKLEVDRLIRKKYFLDEYYKNEN